MKIKIDPEFQKLIPPLTPEEYAQLEANIIADGCREPLTVWQETGILLDGHNRHAICQTHGLEYDTWPLTLPDRLAAKEWIIRNQFGRRNLPTVIHLELSIKLKEVIAERAKVRMSEMGSIGAKKQWGLSKCTNPSPDESPDAPAPTIRASVAPKEEPATTPINTRKEIAEMAGVSEATVHRYEKIAASPDYDAARARILAGETSINAEYQAITGKPHIANNSGNNEWYTPSDIIEAARKVMGDIHLDPASCEEANEIVKAALFFTKEENGLEQNWAHPGGRLRNIWMNPPYSQPEIAKFCERLLDEVNSEYVYDCKHVSQAIVLVNNATDTAWFQSLAESAQVICFTRGRVKFWSPGRDSAAPLQGQAIIYFGNEIEKFREEFSAFGFTVEI